ncbi:hypothetical protein L915_11710 [Phytophthora nicotianae]|uniref:Uncharacterized protein n=1 Tax=Phytophthora nicotianae TaxID=4792 RepID=W2IQH8_PHYNI|nr:hypothetical protein L915_11710 [Phytophthora nicotianae]ETL36371.1 hypothetical protein L916_11634 [Phytophthora nicotianae]
MAWICGTPIADCIGLADSMTCTVTTSTCDSSALHVQEPWRQLDHHGSAAMHA